MVYFPESFEESLKEFEKLIVKDPRYAVPKIKGQGSFSKFVRVCMLVYIKRRTEELMQEKEKKENIVDMAIIRKDSKFMKMNEEAIKRFIK